MHCSYCRKSAWNLWIHPAFSELRIIFGNTYWHSPLLSKVKYHLYMYRFAYLLLLYQRKVCFMQAHILSSSKVLHCRKRSSLTVLHNLFLVNLMYWCSYFRHGIRLSYFGKSNCCSGVNVSQRELIRIDCLMYNLWYPFITDNFYGKNSPWFLVASEAFSIAACTKQDLS